jgi:predicted HicB family RNase H-like nuclease
MGQWARITRFLDPDEVKEVTPVRLMKKEKAAYEKAASKAGLKLSEWIRQTLNNAIKQ